MSRYDVHLLRLPPDDNPPPVDRIEPDRALLRRSRERAGLSLSEAARQLAPQFGVSVDSLRTRLGHFEIGRDHTVDVELYEALSDLIMRRLHERSSPDFHTLAAMFGADEMGAKLRADLRRFRYRIAQRRAQIDEAEAHLGQLRSGLDLVLTGADSAAHELAEVDDYLNHWRRELGTLDSREGSA